MNFIRWQQRLTDGSTIGLFRGGRRIKEYTYKEYTKMNRPPMNLPYSTTTMFVFISEKSEEKYIELIKMVAENSIGKPERIELSPGEYDILWSDEDQALIEKKGIETQSLPPLGSPKE